MLANLDIKELWNVDMHEKSLAGARDFPGSRFNESIYGHKMRLILNGCRPESYVNAGVLLMNLKRIREGGNLLELTVEWLMRRSRMAVAPDQDALNSIFYGDIQVINSKFNTNVYRSEISDCIIHSYGASLEIG